MKCFGYGEEPNVNSWAAVEWTAANVGKVALLATRWSIDPARINERVRKHADGIAANPRGLIELRSWRISRSLAAKRKATYVI